MVGYHSWRQTQTFAVYQCLNTNGLSGDLYEQLKCLFLQPIGADDRRYIGLEFPLLQWLQYQFYPYESTVGISNIFPYFSVALLIALLCACIYAIFRGKSGLIIATLIFFALLKSPILIYFSRAFQPNMVAACFLCFGAIFYLRLNRSSLGPMLMGVGLICYPHYGLISLSVLIYVYCKGRVQAKMLDEQAANLKRQTLSTALWVFGPLVFYVFFSVIFAAIYHGHRYPHELTPDFNSPLEFIYIFIDQFILFSTPISIVFIIFMAFLVGVCFKKYKYIFIFSALLPVIFFTLTYILVSNLFLHSTYYPGFVLVCIIFSMIIVDDMEKTLDFTLLSYPQIWRAIGIVLAGLAFLLPINLVAPMFETAKWYGGQTFVQLIQLPEFCKADAALQVAVEEAKNNRPLYLDCRETDPTCRTATDGIGTNLSARELSIDVIEGFKMAHATYMTCPSWTILTEFPEAQKYLYANAVKAESVRNWVVYHF